MGLLSGPGAAQRAIVEPPVPGPGSAGALPSFASPTVRTSESALRKVAVWSSANLVAGVASMLPLDGFTGTGGDRRGVPLSGFFTDPDGSGQGFDDWTYQALMCWLLRGNVVGKVLARDALGRPAQIELKHPDTSVLFQREGQPTWRFGLEEVPASEVWHRRMFPVPGRPLGLSPVALHATSIGLGLAAEAFGIRWFTDGAHPSAILQNDKAEKVTQEQATTVKQKFVEAIRGTREPVVLGSGWKYQAVQVSAAESQFLDTQQYTSAECARIFGPGMAEVLGYQTGGSLTYSNVEQRSLDLLKFTLDRYFVRFERVLSRDLLPAPRYVRLNRGALLQTDLLTRYRAHELALRNRWTVPNEVRELEDMPAVSWGDEPNSTPAPLQMETTTP